MEIKDVRQSATEGAPADGKLQLLILHHLHKRTKHIIYTESTLVQGHHMQRSHEMCIVSIRARVAGGTHQLGTPQSFA